MKSTSLRLLAHRSASDSLAAVVIRRTHTLESKLLVSVVSTSEHLKHLEPRGSALELTLECFGGAAFAMVSNRARLHGTQGLSEQTFRDADANFIYSESGRPVLQ